MKRGAGIVLLIIGIASLGKALPMLKSGQDLGGTLGHLVPPAVILAVGVFLLIAGRPKTTD